MAAVSWKIRDVCDSARDEEPTPSLVGGYFTEAGGVTLIRRLSYDQSNRLVADADGKHIVDLPSRTRFVTVDPVTSVITAVAEETNLCPQSSLIYNCRLRSVEPGENFFVKATQGRVLQSRLFPNQLRRVPCFGSIQVQRTLSYSVILQLVEEENNNRHWLVLVTTNADSKYVGEARVLVGDMPAMPSVYEDCAGQLWYTESMTGGRLVLRQFGGCSRAVRVIILPFCLQAVLGWLGAGDVVVVVADGVVHVHDDVSGWREVCSSWAPDLQTFRLRALFDPDCDRLVVVRDDVVRGRKLVSYIDIRGPRRRTAWARAVYRACMRFSCAEGKK